MGQVVSIPVAVVLVASLVAAVTDIWKFKVHNYLTLPLLLSGLVYHAAVDGAIGLVMSVFGVIFGFSILIVFFLMGGMGAGDVKLMAAIGAWLGLPLTFYVFLVSALAAGAYAIVLILTYGSLRETWVNLQIIWLRLTAAFRHVAAEDSVEAELSRDNRRRRVIPFAAMVAVGIVGLLLWSWFGAPQ